MLNADWISRRAAELNDELKKRKLGVDRIRSAVGHTPAGTLVVFKSGRTDKIVAGIAAGEGFRSVEQLFGSFLLAGNGWTAAKVAERLDEVFEG